MDLQIKKEVVENDDINTDSPAFEHINLDPGETTYFKSETGDSEWNLEESPTFRESKSDNEAGFECEECSKKFKLKCRLRQHLKKHKGPMTEKSFQCEECDYQCSTNCKLIAHMMKHTGEKPYKCERCEYRCAQKSRLKIHMKAHTGEKPFRCELCDVGYLKQHHLVRHYRTHNKKQEVISGVYVWQDLNSSQPGASHRLQQDPIKLLQSEPTPGVYYMVRNSNTTQDRPWQQKVRSTCIKGKVSSDKKKQHNCHIPGCNKTYKKASHLKAHHKRHTGERLHICTWSLCGRGFIRSDELKRHLRIHTGERQFQCLNCEKRFSRSDHLKKHVKTHIIPKPQPRRISKAEEKECMEEHGVWISDAKSNEATTFTQVISDDLSSEKKFMVANNTPKVEADPLDC